MKPYIVEISGDFKTKLKVIAESSNHAKMTALELLYDYTKEIIEKIELCHSDIGAYET